MIRLYKFDRYENLYDENQASIYYQINDSVILQKNNLFLIIKLLYLFMSIHFCHHDGFVIMN